MSDPAPPRLVTDATGRSKLKVSLPSGRYQLSLDDGGAVLVRDGLGYETRDVVPDLVARVLVATGDAWFPHQRDYESLVDDLPSVAHASATDLAGLAEYLGSKRIPEQRIDTVRELVASTALADRIDPADLQEKELPSVPDGIFDDGTSGGADAESSPESAETGAAAGEPSVDSPGRDEEPAELPESAAALTDRIVEVTGADWAAVREAVDRLLEAEAPPADVVRILDRQFGVDGPDLDVFDIRGVGTKRGYSILTGGFDSVAELAETTPPELASLGGLSEATAMAVIEGARELLDGGDSTAERLARETGVPAERFEAALAQLAPAGVPPSAAEPTLRELYGPSVADVDGVDSRMAYFLHEAGYRTPAELARATTEELEAVRYLGPTTAERVRESARELVDR